MTRANANGVGVTPEETLKNLSNGQSATTVTQKISDTVALAKNVSAVAADSMKDLTKKFRR